MAIEKMTFIDINGHSDDLDEVLTRCVASGLFHPEHAAKLSEYSIGTTALLRNPYGGVRVKISELAKQLDILLEYRPFEGYNVGDREQYLNEAHEFLDRMRREYPACIEAQSREEASADELEADLAQKREEFLRLYSRVKFLHDAYDLRKYVVSIRERFHLVGFVLKKEEPRFVGLFSDLAGVSVQAAPAGSDPRLPTPVRLCNNWFVRPFEMFVNMYGSPSYNDIDPTPFVAYTYSLLFGMMFGDLGQGLCLCLLGVFLWRFKNMQLGAIMSRIGASSMVFGFLYGSVFGFEHLLDGFYQNVLGLPSKPIEIMHPDSTNIILVAAIGIGVAIIFMVILFNILIGVKHRDFDRAVLSHNGVAGLVLYGAILLGIVEVVLKKEFLSALAETVLIVIPLILVFFREPVAHLIRYRSTSDILKRDERLAGSAKFQDGSINMRELFTGQFITARFGRLPTDSYRKLGFYRNEPFMLYPVKTEHDYIWCIYATALSSKEEIDAIFHDLYFERLYIPEEQLKTNELAEAYVKRCVAAGGTPQDDGPPADPSPKYGPVKISRSKTIREAMFPDGIGAFLTQTFFEMFEVILSFVTNTMSFLRVGGFILAHAGMMAVVFTLSGMAGAGASPVVIVAGNLFVMALEGLIVGIQVLRLEFYEIFSRFFDAEGEPFKPAAVPYEEANA